MMNHLLAINSGSSSMKMSLFSSSMQRLWDEHLKNSRSPKDAIEEILQKHPTTHLVGIGHRVVHGGETYIKTTKIDEEVLKNLRELSKFAPLHNPACIEGIETAQHLFPAIPQFAVFDTAFHSTIPPKASTYGIPYILAKKHSIKRYGFHGIAHASLLKAYGKKGNKVITLQLGNGCSICAIADGQSVDTSMGFTPLEGLLMSSRCGDLDPGILEYLCNSEGINTQEVTKILNKESGLLGISGLSTDMKTLLDNISQPQAQLAVDVFCYRLLKYIGAYIAALGGCEALLFGGGIGENSSYIREKVLQGLSWTGVKSANNTATNLQPGQVEKLTTQNSSIEAYAIGVDENIAIVEEVAKLVLHGS